MHFNIRNGVKKKHPFDALNGYFFLTPFLIVTSKSILMINQFTRSHQLLILDKYKTRISRLRKSIREGSFMRYSADKKRQLFQSLARYERQLRQWGIALSAGTLLLLPSDGLLAQTPLPVGSEFRVNTYTTSGQRYPSVAMDSDGDFVVSWQSLGQDGSSYGIYAQRYDNAGVAQGAEFRVNTYTTSQQFYPSVAMDNDGDFVVSWQSFEQDGSNDGIYAQRYMFPPILPIELLHLTGHEEPTANIITWTTATEKNSAWLIIERSSTGADAWTEIGRVAGAGNSTTPVSYKISDDNPLPLGYYRLSSEDFDGTVQHSEVISISRATTELSILNIFPVPVEQEASIIVYMPASGEVNVSLHNTLGQLVFQNNTVLTKGSNDIKMNWGNIPAGNYAVTIGNGISRVVQQVVKM